MKKTLPAECRKVLSHVCENLDTNLNSRRCRSIRKHLASCTNCARYLRELKTTVRLFQRYESARLDDVTSTRLHADIEALSSAKKRT